MIFVFDGKFCGSITDYINDYNEILKKSPNPTNTRLN